MDNTELASRISKRLVVSQENIEKIILEELTSMELKTRTRGDDIIENLIRCVHPNSSIGSCAERLTKIIDDERRSIKDACISYLFIEKKTFTIHSNGFAAIDRVVSRIKEMP